MPIKTSPRLILAAGLCACAMPALAQDTPPPSYAEVSAQTAPVGEAYIAAYTSRDWDALEPLLADDASFHDPTATLVFGDIRSETRAAMMERFRVGYAGLTHMEWSGIRTIVAGEVAVAEGVLHWGLDIGGGKTVDSVTPMVIVVTVKDGKVVSHRDYIDYAPFLKEVREARAEG